MARPLEHLPFVTSLKETAELWPGMSRTQKLGAAAASIVTAAGPVSRILLEAHRGMDQQLTSGQFTAEVAIDLRDKVDGLVARAFDAVTPFGKEVDPFADKIDFLIQELFQYYRNDLPITHLLLRISRDVLVTALRSHVMAATDGQADIGANWHGKVSTALRQTSLRITGLPFEQNIPHFRTVHQTAATGLVLASGARNVASLLSEIAKQTSSNPAEIG
jgi:phosphatidylglycerophosphate synthase